MWNQPPTRWDSQDYSFRPPVRTGSLYPDLPPNRPRSNSMSVIHSSSSLLFPSIYSPTPLSFDYTSPSQSQLSRSKTDVMGDFSFGESMPFDASHASDRSLSDELHLVKLSSEEPIHAGTSLNPNSAEFVPESKKSGKQGNRNGSEHGKAGVKQRDLLEKAMLQQRIVENRIVTLKLRGLPYSVEIEDRIDE